MPTIIRCDAQDMHSTASVAPQELHKNYLISTLVKADDKLLWKHLETAPVAAWNIPTSRMKQLKCVQVVINAVLEATFSVVADVTADVTDRKNNIGSKVWCIKARKSPSYWGSSQDLNCMWKPQPIKSQWYLSWSKTSPKELVKDVTVAPEWQEKCVWSFIMNLLIIKYSFMLEPLAQNRLTSKI